MGWPIHEILAALAQAERARDIAGPASEHVADGRETAQGALEEYADKLKTAIGHIQEAKNQLDEAAGTVAARSEGSSQESYGQFVAKAEELDGKLTTLATALEVIETAQETLASLEAVEGELSDYVDQLTHAINAAQETAAQANS